MMPAINLLPRQRDADRRSQAAYRRAALVALCLGLGVVGVLHLHGRERVAAQRALNAMLTREANQLNAQLQGMAALRSEIESWSGLEVSRVRPARLLATLAQAWPEGVYLKSLIQEGEWVTLRGVARAEQDLSGLLRHLALPHSGFHQPELVEFTGVQGAVAGLGAAPAKAARAQAALPMRTTQFTVRARLAPNPEVDSGADTTALSSSGSTSESASSP